jgi:hypothetical protein
MFSRVDGSMATAARSRRTGGRAVLAREGVPAVLAARRRRKDEPKRSVGNTGNTGNTGNPLPEAGWADGNWRKLLECTTSPPNRGYDRRGMEKGSE